MGNACCGWVDPGAPSVVLDRQSVARMADAACCHDQQPAQAAVNRRDAAPGAGSGLRRSRTRHLPPAAELHACRQGEWHTPCRPCCCAGVVARSCPTFGLKMSTSLAARWAQAVRLPRAVDGCHHARWRQCCRVHCQASAVGSRVQDHSGAPSPATLPPSCRVLGRQAGVAQGHWETVCLQGETGWVPHRGGRRQLGCRNSHY